MLSNKWGKSLLLADHKNFTMEKHCGDKLYGNSSLNNTFESPLNTSKTASVVNVAANGITPPLISFPKHAISGKQPSNSAAVCERKRPRSKKTCGSNTYEIF